MTALRSHAFRRFLTLATPFFRSEMRWLAIGLAVLLMALSLANNSVGAGMSFIVARFMTALSIKDSQGFFTAIGYYLFAVALVIPIGVFYTYTEQRLVLLWRRWLSHYLLGRYLDKRSFYQINLRAEVDNPDQRLEEDVRSFCSHTLMYFLIFFNSTVQLSLYVTIMCSITWMLLVGAVGYAVLGSIASYLLGRPLPGLHFQQLKLDADYRYKLINIRDSAEAIAFFGDEKKEFLRTRQRLKAALQNQLAVIKRNRNLQFFTTGYNYLLTILPTVVVAPLFFRGEIEFGSVIQAQVAFGVVVNALSIVVNHFSNLSVFVAVINRLGSFDEALDKSREPLTKGERIEVVPGQKLEFRGVTIMTPRREQALIENLSFSFEGRSLLLGGPSGSGKSSILRVIAGLWETGSGTIVRPDLSKALFLPQRPYMVLGSLRAQLLYAVKRRWVSDHELMHVIETVRLTDMLLRVGGLDASLDWPNVLGTGEQQRIAFARVLLARPRLVFLDEATTAMDRTIEAELYRLLDKHVERYISCGNPTTLQEFHEHRLELVGDGTWRYS